jgi:hypothetical protein
MRAARCGLCSSLGIIAPLISCTPIHEPTNSALFLVATVDTEVGAATQTSLAIDGTGGVHVAYSQDGTSTLRYATCASQCSDAAGWAHTTVDTTSNSGFFNSIAAAGGSLHVVYQLYNGQGDLRYAVCAATCLQTSSWQVTTVDSAGNTGHDASLAVGGAGDLHVTYLEAVPVAGGLWRLKYAACSTACTTPGNWSTAVLDSAVFIDATSRSLALDASGRLHLAYQKSDTLTGLKPVVYATCASACTSAASWQHADVDNDSFDHAAPVVALDVTGAPSVAYWGKVGPSTAIEYARCNGVCTTTIGWDILPVQVIQAGASDFDQHSLVVDAAARPQMSFQHGGLAYAGCISNCTSPGAWLEFVIDPGVAGPGSSIAGLSGGSVGIAYLSVGNGYLRFAMSN